MKNIVPKLSKEKVLSVICRQFGEEDSDSISNNIIEIKRDNERPFLKFAKNVKKFINKYRVLNELLNPVLHMIKKKIPPKYLYNDILRIDANELLKYSEYEFVNRCYEIILNRAPDADGFNYYLNSLINRNLSKVLIIDSIINSTEAKARNIYIENFKLKIIKAKIACFIYKIPVLGNLAKVIMYMLRLPSEINYISNQLYFLRQEMYDIKSYSTARAADINSEIEELRLSVRSGQIQYMEDFNEIQVTIEELINKIKNLTKKELNLDSYYLAFENKYRGTIEDIKQRQTFYLPKFGFINKEAQHLIVDIGSGRGEWLKLLKENGYTAVGVDLNAEMVKLCISNDFNVTFGDAVEYLKSCESESIDAITGFQIIEHLDINALHQLAIEVKRCLKPGGMFLFETPNPESMYVSTTFYTDFTHNKPLPPNSINFLFEYYGFTDVEIIRTSKKKEPNYIDKQDVDELIWRYNMEQDYAVVGYRL